jgi:hypothetical protein
MAGVAAIASLPLAIGNLLAMLGAVHFDLKGISDPIVLLHAGTGAAGLWRLSMILDIVGYYLPIVPLLFMLRNVLRPRSPNWVDLSTACLLAYCFIGAIGGAILAMALPTLMSDYASATAAHQASLATVFTGYTDAIYRGLWNLLEESLPASPGSASGWRCAADSVASAWSPSHSGQPACSTPWGRDSTSTRYPRSGSSSTWSWLRSGHAGSGARSSGTRLPSPEVRACTRRTRIRLGGSFPTLQVSADVDRRGIMGCELRMSLTYPVHGRSR